MGTMYCSEWFGCCLVALCTICLLYKTNEVKAKYKSLKRRHSCIQEFNCLCSSSVCLMIPFRFSTAYLTMLGWRRERVWLGTLHRGSPCLLFGSEAWLLKDVTTAKLQLCKLLFTA